MTDKKIIFSTGEITYDKEWYIKHGLDIKPVVYTEQFLKEIASKTVGSSLELTHGNNTVDVIGHINDYDFIDNKLVGDVATNSNTEGMGFSPEFSVNFRDKGTKYEAIDGELLKVILTDKPRSHILCNSVEGGSNMSEELLDTLNNQIKDLNKQVAQKEAIIEANKKRLAEVDELQEKIDSLEGKISELENENNTYKSQIDELKPQAESFKKLEDTRRAELLQKAFDDDEEAKKVWENASMEQLESLANHREVVRSARGVGAGNGEGIGEGGEEPDKADSALEYYKKTHDGKEPSFIKGGE